MQPPIPYKNLLKSKSQETITYADLLWTEEWVALRDKITARDKHICQHCNTCRYIYLTEEQIEKAVRDNPIYGKYMDILSGDMFDEITAELKSDKSRFMVGPLDVPRLYHEQNNPGVIIDVHHTYYVRNTLPWDYEHDVFKSLCRECHIKLHEEEEVKIYTDKSLTDVIAYEECSRCFGVGQLAEFHYHMNGVCFKCNGFGRTEKY